MSANEDNGPVRITNREIYDLLQENLQLSRETKQAVTGLTERSEDHETRIRKLETRVVQIVSVGSLLALVVGPIAGAVAGHYL